MNTKLVKKRKISVWATIFLIRDEKNGGPKRGTTTFVLDLLQKMLPDFSRFCTTSQRTCCDRGSLGWAFVAYDRVASHNNTTN